MKPSGTVIGVCCAISLVAIGCGSSPPREERVVRTTTTTIVNDDDAGYRRRANERLYEAKVTSVRAVVGSAEEHCWIEREQVSKRSSVGGAIAGAVVGGILGHQVGRGRGQDIATAGGAIAGGAIGANAGKKYADRDVKRCETVASDSPEYWDVEYDFRGTIHRVQMTDPPGRTVTVNGNGEPRV